MFLFDALGVRCSLRQPIAASIPFATEMSPKQFIQSTFCFDSSRIEAERVARNAMEAPERFSFETDNTTC